MDTFQWLVLGGLGLLILLVACLLISVGDKRDDVVSEVKRINNRLTHFFGENSESFDRKIEAILEGRLREYLGSNRGFNVDGKIEALAASSNKQAEIMQIAATVLKLALPYHSIELLDLNLKFKLKLKGAGIGTIFELREWLAKDDRKEIEGVGAEEFKKIKEAVEKYFREYQVVEPVSYT